MAMHVPKSPGFAQMMKEGAKYFSGLEEAVFRNIGACKQFASTIRTAYGPNGMNKMVINHLEKLFVTNDAATIMRELEVEHPAAKLMVQAAQMQEQEIGDGTSFVIIFAGALLEVAEDLLRMGLTPGEVAEGYEIACDHALKILEKLEIGDIKNPRDKEQVKKVIKSAVMSKQCGNEDFLANLITEACVSISPENTTFNVDNVRVCKILGSGMNKSEVLQGMVFKKSVETDCVKKEKCKIAVFTCPVDTMQTETKGTVLIKSARELMDFSKGEENLVEAQIKSIAEAGASVIVSGGKFGDLAIHYLNKYNILGVRLTSKWDVRRLCKTVGATALPRLIAPTQEELGYCDLVYVNEVGDTDVVVFKHEAKDSRVATIIIRGSTENYMDDIERAIDDGVNNFKAITKCGVLVPGAGATEMELAHQLAKYGESCPGIEQYSIQRYSQALERIPTILAENNGIKSPQLLSKLYAAHMEGNSRAGIDIDADGAATLDAKEAEIFDLYLTKKVALMRATKVACTILNVDQIIMAKPAGGPKKGPDRAQDDD